MASAAWSTQQLAEFVSAVSAAESEAAAALAAVEHAAEAFDADAAAIVSGGEVVASVGYPRGGAPVAELEAVRPGAAGCSLEVPGVGPCAAAAVALEHPPGATLVVARAEADGLSRDEVGLLRGMARVASLTMRMQHVVGEQAALRRVATLVAEVAPPDTIFSAVAEEVGRLIPEANLGLVSRYDSGASGELVGTWSRTGNHPPVGLRFPLGGQNLHTLVFETGRPARIDHLVGDAAATVVARELGARSSAGAPIVVAGRLWGVIVVASPNENGFPDGVEHRLADFTELVATAIAKVQAREELRTLSEEQAALRRVATLVARGEPPNAVFAAVAEEVGRIVPAADVALVGRYDSEGALELVGGWSSDGDPSFVGARVPLGGRNVSTLVFERNEPARVDYVADDAAPASALAREWARSSAGAPVNVEGRLWGVVVVGSLQPDGLPPGVEHELAGFTELVATAIANSQARAELGAVVEWQAGLRRVATQVARGELPEAVFAAIANELGRLFRVDATGVIRYEPDDVVTSVGSWTGTGQPAIPGERTTLGGQNVTTLVYETGRPARIDAYAADDASAATAIARRFAMRSAVGAPMYVGGRLWGSLQVASLREDTLPVATEERLEAFADLAAIAIANAQAREELRTLADEQAALRRVATLVARPAPPAEVFAAVTDEVGRLLSADVTGLVRYDADDGATLVSAQNPSGVALPAAEPGPLRGRTVTALVRETGRPVRLNDYAAEADTQDSLPTVGIRSAVGVPITVEGRLWGSITVGSMGDEPPPPDTESRLARFTELVATAIANAQSREQLRVVADEQAALRRVATLVAEGAPPAAIFAAVVEELGRLVQSDRAFIGRYEIDNTVTVVSVWSPSGETMRVGARGPIREHNVSDQVRQTRRAARVDVYPDGAEGIAASFGYRSAVGAPITVSGRLWGLMVVGSGSDEPPPPETEERLTKFTELVATAIANAQTRAELTASRARIVATADDTRHRIERDLHDGAQQRLVTTALKLRAAEASVPPELGELAAELSSVAADMKSVLDELREFARGIHPAILSEAGLVAALGTLARTCAVPVELSTRVDERPSETVEVAAYYVVSEALANATKHAEASVVWVDVTAADDVLRIDVRDDGVGGVDPARGSGLVGLRDRVEALGGRISVESPRGKGTSIQVELPLGGDAAANRSHVEGGSP